MKSRIITLLTVILSTGTFIPAEAATVNEVFKRVRDSVVVIQTKQQVIKEDKQTLTAKGLGSGFLISEDGKVMTAAHVVQTADSVEVMFAGGEIVQAKVIASEPAADVALLKVRRVPRGAVVAELGDSDKVEVGDQIFIIGAPYGLSYTLTVGYISARHKPHTMTGEMTLAEFFQTDAAVNKGNSGGPMFNMRGEVIGIVSWILSQSGGFEGLGFVATAKTAREHLVERKSFWNGVEGYMLEGDLADIFNLPQKRGVLIQRVAMGSPASRIGVRGGTLQAKIGDETLLLGGDIVLEVEGMSFAEDDGYLKIRKHVNSLPSGSKISIKVLRAGVIRTMSTELKR